MESFMCPCGEGICSYNPQSRSKFIVVQRGQPSVIESAEAERLIDDTPAAAESSQQLPPVELPADVSYDDLIDTLLTRPLESQYVASLLPQNDGIIVTCSCNHVFAVPIRMLA